MYLSQETECTDTHPVHIHITNIKEHPWHYHETALEIIYVVKGELHVNVSIYTYMLRSGDIAVINYDALHHYHAANDNVTLLFHMDLDYFLSIIPEIKSMLFICSPSSEKAESHYYHLLKHQLKSILSSYYRVSEAEDNQILINDAVHCLSNLVNHFSSWQQNGNRVTSFSPYKKKDFQLERLNRITNFLYDNLSKKITLDDLAKLEYVSKYYISRVISEGIGMSFQSYLNLLRVEYAQHLLYGTDCPIAEISEKCGFSSTNFFRKTYEKYMGATPAMDRKRAYGHTMHRTAFSEAKVLDDGLPITTIFDMLGLSYDSHAAETPSSTHMNTQLLEINMLETEAGSMQQNNVYAAIHSPSQLVSMQTLEQIEMLKQCNCCNTISVPWNALCETLQFFKSTEWIHPLIKCLSKNSMRLELVSNEDLSSIDSIYYVQLLKELEAFRFHRMTVKVTDNGSVSLPYAQSKTLPQLVSMLISDDENIHYLPFKQLNAAMNFLFYANNMKTPLFHCLSLIDKIGSKIIQAGNNRFITKKEDILRILLINKKTDENDSVHMNYVLKIKNLNRNYICCIYDIAEQPSRNLQFFKTESHMASLNKRTLELLERTTFPKFDIFTIDATPDYMLYLTMPPGSIKILEIY